MSRDTGTTRGNVTSMHLQPPGGGSCGVRPSQSITLAPFAGLVATTPTDKRKQRRTGGRCKHGAVHKVSEHRGHPRGDLWRQPQRSVAQGRRPTRFWLGNDDSYHAAGYEAMQKSARELGLAHVGTATQHPHLATHTGGNTHHSPQRPTTRAKSAISPNPGFHLLP